MLVDLRGFTSQLDAAVADQRLQEFCGRLAEFYSLCHDAARLAAGESGYHMASTGDGMVTVFHGERHAAEGYLSGLLLRLALPRLFPTVPDAYGNPTASFGIGLESGEVCRVLAGGRATYIGQCINLASRLEAITKTLDSADCVMGEQLTGILYRAIAGENLDAMSRAAVNRDTTDRQHLELLGRFGKANHTLCLNFLHYHRLKGVDRPIALHGVSKRASMPGNPRFEALLDALCVDAPSRAEVRAWIDGRG
jgi:class 3 adenylate cyclase